MTPAEHLKVYNKVKGCNNDLKISRESAALKDVGKEGEGGARG